MNVLSLCGPESGLPKNPSVSNHDGMCKNPVVPWRNGNYSVSLLAFSNLPYFTALTKNEKDITCLWHLAVMGIKYSAS